MTVSILFLLEESEENRRYSQHGHGPDSIDDIPLLCAQKHAVYKIWKKKYVDTEEGTKSDMPYRFCICSGVT